MTGKMGGGRGWVVAFSLFIVSLRFFPSSSVSSPLGLHSRTMGKRPVQVLLQLVPKETRQGNLCPGLSRGNHLHREANGTVKPLNGPTNSEAGQETS